MNLSFTFRDGWLTRGGEAKGSSAGSRQPRRPALISRSSIRNRWASAFQRFSSLKTRSLATPLVPDFSIQRGVVRAQLSVAEKFGADVLAGTRVEKIDLSRERPEIQTTAGAFRARRLVITAGPWAGDLLQDLNLPLRVTRQQKFYFAADNTDNLGPERLPVYTDLDTEFYGFPLYGPGVKAAYDSLGETTSPPTIDRTLDIEKGGELGAWLSRIMPGAGFRFLEGGTCMYTMTPDEDFLIGPHPRNPAALIAAGFSGHGFKFATLVGRILTELAVDGETSYPISRFRLDRFEK